MKKRITATEDYLRLAILSGEDLVHGLIELYSSVRDRDDTELNILRKRAIQVYQEELRQLLVYLLQSRENFLPWRRLANRPVERVKALVELACCIDESVNDGQTFKLNALNYSRGSASYQKLSVFISEGYRLLEEHFLPQVYDETQASQVTIPPVDLDDYKQRGSYLSPIVKLYNRAQREMKPFLHDLLLLGSLATLDYEPGFSDIDALLIVNRPAVLNPDSLLSLRDKVQRSLGYLYLLDTCQHHGYMMTTEIDLKYYPQTVMPVEALSYSRSLLGTAGDSYLEIRIRDADIERKRDFCRQYLYIKKLHEDDSSVSTLYDMKYFVSLLLLLPTLYLQLLGTHCYKKHSFEKASRDFRPEVWQIVERASTIRKEWPEVEGYPPSWYRTILSTSRFYPPLLGLARYYYLKMRSRVPDWIILELGENYVADAAALVEEMLQRAKQAGKL